MSRERIYQIIIAFLTLFILRSHLVPTPPHPPPHPTTPPSTTSTTTPSPTPPLAFFPESTYTHPKSHPESLVRKRTWIPPQPNSLLPLGLNQAKFPPGSTVNLHSHPTKAEVFLFFAPPETTSGSSRPELTFLNTVYDLSSGEDLAVLVPPATPHSIVNSGDTLIHAVYFGLPTS